MNELLRLAFKHNFDNIMNGSLKHCHARGVHSITFNGSKIRAFIATKDHELYLDEQGNFPVAIHDHHCDIRLTHLAGNPTNWRSSLFPRTDNAKIYNSFRYQSGILGAKASFEKMKVSGKIVIGSFPHSIGKYSGYMDATQLHTITVPKNEEAAWLVEEGQEWKDYQPHCYSNKDLTKFDFNGMYERMDGETLLECYRIIFGETYA